MPRAITQHVYKKAKQIKLIPGPRGLASFHKSQVCCQEVVWTVLVLGLQHRGARLRFLVNKHSWGHVSVTAPGSLTTTQCTKTRKKNKQNTQHTIYTCAVPRPATAPYTQCTVLTSYKICSFHNCTGSVPSRCVYIVASQY